MPRLSLEEINALLADNNEGDITPAVMREVVHSLYYPEPAFVPPESPNAVDDEFETDSIGDWTSLFNGSGSLGIRGGQLHLWASNDTSKAILLRPGTLEVGDHLTIGYRAGSTDLGQITQPLAGIGIVVADGNTLGAAAVQAISWGNGVRRSQGGTLLSPSDSLDLTTRFMGWAFLRLQRTGASTWLILGSQNGYDWSPFTHATRSLTPTHLGVLAIGGSDPEVTGTIGFFRKNWNP